MGSSTLKVSGDISAQVLGLTDKHIHYVEQSDFSKKLGIHQLMLNDFQALVSNAARSGIAIKIASGFRSFDRQLLIWNNKFTGKTAIKNIDGEPVDISKLNELEIIRAILLFSALPGASRHHWGCDLDIYDNQLLAGKKLQLEPWEYATSGPMAKLSAWLSLNAQQHGFYFPYDKFRGGIAAEPWHLSYAPLAKQYQSVINIELLHQCLLPSDIAGKKTILDNLPEIFTSYITNVNTVTYSLTS